MVEKIEECHFTVRITIWAWDGAWRRSSGKNNKHMNRANEISSFYFILFTMPKADWVQCQAKLFLLFLFCNRQMDWLPQTDTTHRHHILLLPIACCVCLFFSMQMRAFFPFIFAAPIKYVPFVCFALFVVEIYFMCLFLLILSSSANNIIYYNALTRNSHSLHLGKIKTRVLLQAKRSCLPFASIIPGAKHYKHGFFLFAIARQLVWNFHRNVFDFF